MKRRSRHVAQRRRRRGAGMCPLARVFMTKPPENTKALLK